MSIAELLKKAQFVADGDGNKKAVVVDYAIWEEILTLLEDLEDAEEVGRLHALREETVDWNVSKNELRAAGKDV